MGALFTVAACSPAGSKDAASPNGPGSAATDAKRVAELRARGPAELRQIGRELDALAPNDPARPALSETMDRVAGQHDAWASRLFWYTDLAEAERVAHQSGKPILSLRMLGKLTDELSCANSRFFRTVLYPDARVRQLLSEKYVLHWSSERPAPVISIDFGDGRKVVRTITGNSIHYVLDEHGQPLDAMPGLVGAGAFVTWLGEAAALDAEARAAAEGPARIAVAIRYHARKLQQLSAQFRTEAARLGIAQTQPLPQMRPFAGTPTAAMAIPIAVSKAAVENPMLRKMAPTYVPTNVPDVESTPWNKFAPLHASEARLDENARSVVRAKSPRDWRDARNPRKLDDAAFEDLVRALEASIAEDTAKNALAMHAQIHAWLANEPMLSYAGLNARVYEIMFLTPASDPWLGLVPPRVYTGLQDDGMR